jgi:hypothetical protein
MMIHISFIKPLATYVVSRLCSDILLYKPKKHAQIMLYANIVTFHFYFSSQLYFFWTFLENWK